MSPDTPLMAHSPIAARPAAPDVATVVTMPERRTPAQSADAIATLWADLETFHRARQAQDQVNALQSRQRFD
jgi:hypothetical protein